MLLQQENVQVFLIVLTEYNVEVMAELGVQLPEKNILRLHQPAPYLSLKSLLQSHTIIGPILGFISKNAIAVVVAHAPYAHFVMRLVKLTSYMSSYSFTLHQYFHGLQYAQFPINSLSRFSVNKLNQILAVVCDDSHIYISKATREDVEKNLIRIKRQQVLYNPISAAQVLSESKVIDALLAPYLNTYIIVLPGRLDHNKGQLFFLNVFKKFLRQNDIRAGELVLLLVGAGEIEDELRIDIAESNLENYIKLFGELPNMELRYMLSFAQFVVVPSFIEGLSFVALETLAAGKILLTSDAGGLKEVVIDGETGFIFKAGDERDCLVKLNYIYQNRVEQLIDRIEIEQDLKQRFSCEQYKKQFLKYLFNVSVR